MNNVLKKAVEHWEYIAPIISFPRNEKELIQLQEQLDQLLDLIGHGDNHSLMGLVDIISNTIALYEEQNYQQPLGRGIDALKHLMNEHRLSQKQLPEIGSQGVVSEILNGKRSLNLRQIESLSKQFNVSPATFMEGF